MSLDVATYILVGLFTLAGVLSIAVSVTNADWFFRSPNVRILTGKMRRPYARLLYTLIGLAILAMAAAVISTPLAKS